MDQKILGFNVGDERICGNDKHGTSVGDWNTIINTMRNSFPRGQAIIYTNECASTFENTANFNLDIPDSLDWIGFDRYYSKSDTHGFIKNTLKPAYEKYLYPKLKDHHKVAITPQVTNCQKLGKNELDDAKDAVAWAQSDPRVTFILPYRLDDLEGHCKGSDLYNFWVNYGKGTKQ